MTASTINACEALVAAKVAGALDSGGHTIFKQVAIYPIGVFTGYPSATVMGTGGSEGAVIDTHRIERTFTVQVKLYQEQSAAGKDPQAAALAMRTALDALILAFDKDRDLGGQVEIVRVVKMSWDYRVQAGTFEFATLDVACLAVVPRQ